MAALVHTGIFMLHVLCSSPTTSCCRCGCCSSRDRTALSKSHTPAMCFSCDSSTMLAAVQSSSCMTEIQPVGCSF